MTSPLKPFISLVMAGFLAGTVFLSAGPASAQSVFGPLPVQSQFQTFVADGHPVEELDESFGPSAVVFQKRLVGPGQTKLFVAVAVSNAYFPCGNNLTGHSMMLGSWNSQPPVLQSDPQALVLEGVVCRSGFVLAHSGPEQSERLAALLQADLKAQPSGRLALKLGTHTVFLAPASPQSQVQLLHMLP
ncbi:hypothetical protein [Oecophyllibacter saccharovorans]|uniref:Uncharacterized protein n=1 Tax=Oecophyllibacter saccharovorans TaxID=2558360 RepID=A0A506URP7_9PROT|nr:hypothetical protein [Oecophyllibacter saccharovorans]TPW35982.1 hypothetical protein E3202_03455 [Oecophyllibacter saccharovorans]